jgi:hypothetical protein
MAPSDDTSGLQEDGDGAGFLLGLEENTTAAGLYDPMTGKALLVPGAPIDHHPPPPDQVRIGIIDSGVLPDHPQLRNLVVAMKDFTGDDPIDRTGHGTVVAIQAVRGHSMKLQDIAAGDPERASRLARSPALVSAKVTGPAGRIELEHVIEAIHWMAAEGVQVVNMSLGFLGKAARYRGLCEAIIKHDKILFCAAAGNFGPHVSVYPAACGAENLINVGAVIGGEVWAQSGQGEIYEEGRVTLLPPYLYHHEEAQRAARAGAFDRARASYLASLALEANAPALFGLAVLDLHAGQLDAACASLTQAAALEPDNAEIEGHLGAVKLMQERPAEAIGHLNRAVELDPDSVRARKNRSIALAQLDRPQEALADLFAARQIAEDTSAIDEMIADLLRR